MIEKAQLVLNQYWGYSKFRSHQIPIVQSIIDGRDTIGLLTTGGGKSICFQVPALMKEGMCLVVSPLIALMKDQVEQLKKRKIPAASLYTGQKYEVQNKILDYAISGKLKFLYVAPERLISSEFLNHLHRIKLCYLVIDEAHCISQWGYDFRPSYLRISEVYSADQNVPRIALTATATARVLKDIEQLLELRSPSIVQSSFYRENLSYQLKLTETKLNTLCAIIQKHRGSGLIYVQRRSIAEEISKQLRSSSGRFVDFYHAGLSMEERSQKQERWLNNPDSLMVSTNAFGMGIDHPNVNFVIHYHFPDNLESYFQEAGRAGRSGQSSSAIALISQADIKEKEAMLESYPTLSEVKKTLLLLFNYFDTPYEMGLGVRKEFIIEHFVEKYKLNLNHTQRVLQILIDSELITLEAAYYRPSEIKLLLNETEMDELMSKNSEQALLLKNLIRTYEGIYYGKKVNLEKIARTFHYQIQDLKAMLYSLRRDNYIEYIPAISKPMIEFLVNKTAQEHISLNEKIYHERKEVFMTNLKNVLYYLKNEKICRSQILLLYFGEVESNLCGICDVCIKNNSTKKVSSDEYLKIRDNILSHLESKVYIAIDKLIKVNQAFPERAVRKVLDRLIELGKIERGIGDVFRKI